MMYRKPAAREHEHQEFALVLCRAELFALHQALTSVSEPDGTQLMLRLHVQNLLYPNSAPSFA